MKSRKAQETTKARPEVIEAIEMLAKEKDISEEMLYSSIEEAVKTAYKKNLPKNSVEPTNLVAHLSREDGSIKVYTRMIVVEEVENPAVQITLQEARMIRPDAELNDIVEKDVVDLALAHVDGADVAFGGGFGEEDVGGFVVHAYGAHGGLFLRLLTGLLCGFLLGLEVGFGIACGGGLGGTFVLTEQRAVDRRHVHCHRQHFVGLDVVAEVGVGIAVDHHVVVVGEVQLSNGDVELSIVGHSEFVPYCIMFKLRKVGMTFVRHHLHDAACALGGRGRAESLVNVDRYSEDAIATIVGELGKLNSRLVAFTFLVFLAFFRRF